MMKEPQSSDRVAADAIQAFQQALDDDPSNLDVGLQMVRACLDYAQALTPVSLQEVDPLAIPVQATKYLAQAEAGLRNLTQVHPDSFRALGLMGVLHSIYYRSAEALACFEDALVLVPDNPALSYNRAYCLAELGRYDEAEKILSDLSETAPQDGMVWHLLGQVRQQMGRVEEALQPYQQAASLLPDSARTCIALHTAYAWLGRSGEAMKTLQEGARKFPDNRELCFQLGAFALSVGDWRTGWRHYHCRSSVKQHRQPIPEGGIFPWSLGKPVRVRFDQGLGDELFFLRFLPVLHARGMIIHYTTQHKLLPLLQGNVLFGELSAARTDEPTSWDVVVGDFPYLAGMFDKTAIPSAFCLPISEENVHGLRKELASFGRPPYLGVTWQAGSVKAGGQKGVWRKLHKEISPAVLGGLAQNWPGTVVVLQRVPREEDMATFSGALGRSFLDWTALNEDLPTMLAGLSLLDEYVGVSNTNMHLLAGISRTARVLIPYPADWRWMIEGDESPWFPGFKVYRQDRNQDWRAALDSLSADLKEKWG